MRTTVVALLFVVGLVKALPLIGVLGAQRLTSLYGIATDDASLILLLQHRALLFGLLGGFMMFAAFRPALHGVALIGGLVSTLGFITLAWLGNGHSPQIERVVMVDIVLSTLLLPAAVFHLARASQEYRTETIA